MPGRHHSHRAREYGEVVLHPHHGVLCEVIIELVMLLSSIMFVLGSMCFFSGLPFQVLEIGELLFMVSSAVYVAVGILEMYEMCQSKGESLFSNSEFHEQTAYLISAIVFAAGTVLFWPTIYRGDKAAEEKGETIAAWCFVTGSLGFVIAGFWNALSLADSAAEDEEAGPVWRHLTKTALFCNILGGMMFVTGSYLYTLDTEESCDPFVPTTNVTGQAVQTKNSSNCVLVTDQGTILYTIGSVLYTIQAILNCVKVCARNCINKRTGYCEVTMHGDNDSDTDRVLFDAEDAAE